MLDHQQNNPQEKNPRCNQQGAYLRNLCWLLLTALVILFDQLTKHWAQVALTLYSPHELLGVFNLTLAYNQGAAFSFLAGASGWQRWFLAALAIVASLVLIIWLARLKPGEKWLAASLALILGGALGNLIDRLQHGYVVDFLDFHWGFHHFPAFNLADSAITLGAILLVIDMMTGREKHD
jgi:signal peptidase II